MSKISNSVIKEQLFAESKLSETQMALVVKHNVAVGDWDEYIHMRPWAANENVKHFVSLRNYAHKRRRFMTYRTGFYFLGSGLVLLAVSVSGALLHQPSFFH